VNGVEWSEIRVSTEEPCAEVIAGLFHEWGAGGVIIEDPYAIREHIAQGIWDAHSFEQEYLERSCVVIRAFYPAPYAPSVKQIDDLKSIAGDACHIEVLTVRDEDWADNWKAYYHTTRTGRNLVIKPSWERYEPQEGDLIIELDPGMAFGTGTHITTRQCLEILETSLIPGQSVLDIGTGSGILSIAAAKLGAREIKAIDNDPVAVEIARQNVKKNGVEHLVTIEQQDLAEFNDSEVDLIVANLTAPVFRQLIDRIVSLTLSGGMIIAGGIGKEQWPGLKEAMKQHGLNLESIKEDEDWVAVLARRV
jgi:ribosomal protein L11 methyltransferase